MEYEIEGNILVAKLEHEEDFFESLEKIMSEIEQKSAVLVTAIGMLNDFSLGFYNMETGEYEFKEYNEPMELVSVHGSITEEGSIHMHAQLADENHHVHGGHLENGTVFNVNEITMLVFNDLRMTRERDEELDTDLLSVK